MEQQNDVSRLREMHDRTVAQIMRLREELREAADAAEDGEAAADAYERGKTVAFILSLQRREQALARAIDQAARGAYGICERCGTTIPEERLEIIPEATLCVQCADEHESSARRSLPMDEPPLRYADDDDGIGDDDDLD